MAMRKAVGSSMKSSFSSSSRIEGKELPLVECPSCKIPVIKLRSNTVSNPWRIFYKCKNNIPKICAFYLASDYNGACGPTGFGDDSDKPELFIVRFQRNATHEALKAEKKTNLMEIIQGQHTTDASQLVAKYNGPDEIQEINKWISQIIKDGDTREIPYFTSKVPDLVPEETSKEWLRSTKSIRSVGKSLKERVQNSGFHFRDYLTDPRIGPTLLLCACISLGTIWLKNNRPTQNTPQVEAPKDKAKRRPRPKLSTSLFGQPTIPDPEPKDARQWEMSDSDSD